MFFKSLIGLLTQINLLFLTMVFCTSCENVDVEDSVGQNSEFARFKNVDSLSLKSDCFSLSSTHSMQFEIYQSLFLSNDSPYNFPGNLSPEKKRQLFEEIREGYFTKSVFLDQEIKKYYHNFAHAMDVMITTHVLLKSGGAVFLTQDEQAMLVLAALAHDARHTGLMNSFLIKAEHEYARKFEHESLQEKQSLLFLLGLLESKQLIPPNKDSKIRKFLSEVILFTDMKKHKEQLQKVKKVLPVVLDELRNARGDKNSDITLGTTSVDLHKGIDLSSRLDEGTRFLIGSFILHCADISNPGKDWEQSERWAVLVLNEFFTQGDFEKQNGMQVSMNCDREKTSIPESQLGFGKYIIKELYDILLQLNHEAGSQFQENFLANQLRWTNLRADEKLNGTRYLPNFRPPSIEGGWNGKE
tara:strand:- start:2618 stop:3859 length:1242 start_codon:yes stop_codon:yes gene_type:complete